MSSITDWIKYELYPVLYDNVDRAFPEHNFKRFSGDWISNTYLDGSQHTRRDKTKIAKKVPDRIFEQGDEGNSLSLVDYVIKRDGVDFITSVRTLADVVGLKLPEATEFDKESYIEYKKQASILEDCNSYFIFCLENSQKAQSIKDYLEQERGYSPEEIKEMELGYIPSQAQLFKYLEEKKGHDKNTIQEVVKLNSKAGKTHSLTMPYRSGGTVKGFNFRTITNETPKYVKSVGMDKTGGFFNLSGIKGNKDLIIVEGELDSLHATVKGIDNVVAAGGSSITSEQVKDAIRRGAKMFTLCFDYEPGKEEETHRKTSAAIQVILNEGVDRIYIAGLQPEDPQDNIKVDPDSLIKTKGIDALKKAINEAPAYFEYQLEQLLNKYLKGEEDRQLSAKEADMFLDEAVATAVEIKSPTDRDQYKNKFLEWVPGITEESLDIVLDRITSTKDKEEQDKAFKKLLSEASQLQHLGKVDEAIELISEKTREVKLKNKATQFDKLLSTTSEEEMKKEEAILPDSLNSGYSIGKDEILLPGGQISVFVGATGHGKTITLINTALNVLDKYPDQEFVFFTYEERASMILQYFINTYINIDLNAQERGNRRLIRDYFKKGSTQYMSSDNVPLFEEGKTQFFKKYIETGRLRIKSVSFDSEELDLAIRYLHKERPNLGGVFIDYFQLINLPGKTMKENRINSRQEQLKRICQELNNTAKETGLPLVFAAQFNRSVTDVLKLHATNISEAGDIERIVNTLIGIWDVSKKASGENGNTKDITARLGSREKGMYMEILKSRDIATGGYEIFGYNGNTGKISNDLSIEGIDVF